MEKKLKKLFDFQAFSGNKELEEMLQTAENRHPVMLDDDDLFFVAAGVNIPEEKKEEKKK